MAEKSDSSTDVGVQLSFANVFDMKVFSDHTFHHPSFDKLKNADAKSLPVKQRKTHDNIFWTLKNRLFLLNPKSISISG